MRLRWSKKLVAGAAAVTLLSGGAGAFAATQLSSNPRQAYIDDVASRLNVTPTALTSAMKQAMIDQINAAVTAGKLTAAQASAVKSRIESGHAVGGFGGPGGPGPGLAAGGWRFGQGRFGCGGSSTSTTTTPCRGGPPPGFGGRFGRFPCGGQSTNTSTTSTSTTSTTAMPCPGGPGFGRHAGLAGFGAIGMWLRPGLVRLIRSAVTSYLGISAAKLRSDLAAGNSLAQIASALAGKSVSGLESALTAAVKTQLEKAVSAGWMSSTQEAKELSALASRLATLVNRSSSFTASAVSRTHRSRSGHGPS